MNSLAARLTSNMLYYIKKNSWDFFCLLHWAQENNKKLFHQVSESKISPKSRDLKKIKISGK